jgi:transaldolase
MRPANLNSKIFLDGGDPSETREALKLLGFLDGQTTNPTLIAKNPIAQEKIKKGEKFSPEEILYFYKDVVKELSILIPDGSISVEVYSDFNTKAEEMLSQAEEMFSWIPNAHIKVPITFEGLKTAELAIKKGIRINMTLCFTQEQAAAVYSATKGAKKGDVFVSPFVGRLDDKGENGMDLIANIIKMFEKSDRHVEVVTASVRNYNHFLYAMKLGSDIITTPFKILKEWVDNGMPVVNSKEIYEYDPKDLKSIEYKNLDLSKDWKSFNINHELTDVGLERFANDWMSLIK